MSDIKEFSDQWILARITKENVHEVMIDRAITMDVMKMAIKHKDERVCSIVIEKFKEKEITDITKQDGTVFVEVAINSGNAFVLRELLQLEGYGLLSNIKNKRFTVDFLEAKPEIFKLLLEFKCNCCSASLADRLLYDAHHHQTIPLGIIQHAPMEFLNSLDENPTACASLKEAIRRRRAGESLEEVCIAWAD